MVVHNGTLLLSSRLTGKPQVSLFLYDIKNKQNTKIYSHFTANKIVHALTKKVEN